MIQEGNITLYFTGNHIKYDDSKFYRSYVTKCHEAKAVDILALDKQPLYMVEIKDFRNFRIENKQRISNGDLVNEFSKKIRDTIAGLYGSYRKNNLELEIYHKYLFYNPKDSKPVCAILLMEEDKPNNYEEKNRKKIMKALKDKIEQQLRFLSLRIEIVNIQKMNSIPGWKIF